MNNKFEKYNIYILISIFAVFSFLFPITTFAQFPFLIPFGGKIVHPPFPGVCTCVGQTIITVQDKRTNAPISFVYLWGLDVLKKFGVIPDEIPIPTLYMYYNVFTPGVEVLGQFIPVPNAPCLTYTGPVPPFCAPIPSGTAGYLFQMGTTLTPTLN